MSYSVEDDTGRTVTSFTTLEIATRVCSQHNQKRNVGDPVYRVVEEKPMAENDAIRPAHYGADKDDPFEHQKVVRAWGLGYHLGNATKYICRGGKKPGADVIQDLEKAICFIQMEIDHHRAERKAKALASYEKNRELDPRD